MAHKAGKLSLRVTRITPFSAKEEDMPAIHEPIHAPDFQAGEWLNSPPLSMAALRGQVVLIDFWDYTSINCLRSLPYVLEWWRRYRDAGLLVVGIHTPQFAFQMQGEYVRQAVQRLGVSYPVLVDNARRTWSAWANRFWPSWYLLNTEGLLRFFHYGEGEYLLTESTIQALLREITPGTKFLPPMLPVRADDEPGAACYSATSELDLGSRRGLIGNPEGLHAGQTIAYLDPGNHLPDTPYLAGEWQNEAEAVTLASAEGSVSVRYRAKEVYAVITPPRDGQGRVEIMQDNAPPENAAGVDLTREGDAWVIRVDAPRLYAVIANPHFGGHELRLRVKTPGLSIYALTFITECIANGEEAEAA